MTREEYYRAYSETRRENHTWYTYRWGMITPSGTYNPNDQRAALFRLLNGCKIYKWGGNKSAYRSAIEAARQWRRVTRNPLP